MKSLSLLSFYYGDKLSSVSMFLESCVIALRSLIDLSSIQLWQLYIKYDEINVARVKILISFDSFFYKLANPSVSKMDKEVTDEKQVRLMLLIVVRPWPHPNSLSAGLGRFIYSESVIINVKQLVKEKTFPRTILTHKGHKSHWISVVSCYRIKSLIIQLYFSIR